MYKLRATLFSLALILCVSPAFATWDPAQFVTLLTSATESYNSQNYTQALEQYQQLAALLDEAISKNEIPAEQLPRAEQAREDIRYQIGRSQQQLEQCAEADATFSTLQGSEKLSDSARKKLTIRLVETQLCLGEQSLAAEPVSFPQTQTHLTEADARLAVAATASADFSAEQKQELSEAQTRREALGQARTERYVTSVQQSTQSGDCSAAQAQIAGAPAAGVDPAALTDAQVAFDDACGEAAILEYMPFVAMGVGGALILTGILIDATAADDVDEFIVARDACTAGDGSACPRALDLANDVESSRNTSIGLFAAGVAVAAGGVVWWLLTSDVLGGDDEAPETEAGDVSLLPSVGPEGAHLGLQLTW